MKTMNETTESIKSAGKHAGESLSRATEHAKTELIDPASEAIRDALHRGETFARHQGENLVQWVTRQPLAAVGAAFGLGVLVALYARLKR